MFKSLFLNARRSNMVKRSLLLLIAMALSLLVPPAAPVQGQGQTVDDGPKFRRVKDAIPNQYNVALKDAVDQSSIDPVASDMAFAHGGNIKRVFKHAIKGFTIELSEQAAKAMSEDSRVEFVEEDGMVYAEFSQSPAPWGLDRIDQRAVVLNNRYTYANTGAGVNVYVIDTGIRTSHQEFGGRASVAFDTVRDGWNGQDCYGHGTHVAGIVGGGTYGVAKNARLYSVRVLGCDGRGSTSAIVEGVDWVTAYHRNPAVANMSLGGPANSFFDRAVRTSISSGVTYAVAAGNESLDANFFSPARVVEGITVGAVDRFNTMAYFSNYGPVLDIFAPGVDIQSAWPLSDSSTNTISGTSMAAPHVAGAAALYLERNPGASPATVGQWLRDNATRDALRNIQNSGNYLLFVSGNPFQGYLDGADCSSIIGWAWDSSRPNDPISVAIYDNNNLLAVVPANLFRQDLLNAGIGNGTHAYSFALPAYLRDGQPHSISARVPLTGQALNNSPRAVTCALYEGRLDGADCNFISGWVWDGRRPNSPINVDIFDGNTLLMTVPADKFRADLLAAGKGNGYHAFSVPLPQNLVDKQNHMIWAKVSGSGFNLNNSPRAITCGLQYEGFLDTADCRTVSGWAWDRTRPNSPIDVDIFDGQTLIATVPANRFRHDLLVAGKGNGYHAFKFTASTQVTGRIRSISVRAARTNVYMVNSPRSVDCR